MDWEDGGVKRSRQSHEEQKSQTNAKHLFERLWVYPNAEEVNSNEMRVDSPECFGFGQWIGKTAE